MDVLASIKKILLASAYSVALGVVVAFLFFPKEFDAGKEFASQFLGLSDAGDAVLEERELRIGLVSFPEVIEPTSLDVSVRSLALQMYEPLVRTNAYFGIQPSLAISWGRVSPTIWKFELRPNVMFHDNSPLTIDDVIGSFQRAAAFKNSDLKATVKGMSIEPKGKMSFEIRTEYPDPQLLEKISTVLILPQQHEKKTTFAPVGTGPYTFLALKQQSHFSFQAFASYWGNKPAFKKLKISFYPRRDDREKALLNRDVDVVSGVPPESIAKLQGDGLRIDVRSSLEVNYLVFNQGGVLKDAGLRQAVSLVLDSKTFVDLALGYADASSQYVSSGVLGFNTTIPARVFDAKRAAKLVKTVSGFDLIPLSVSFVKGQEVIGNYLQTQLQSIGFDPVMVYRTLDEFRENYEKGESDLYFFGWKSDLGSAADFYAQAVHAKGTYNLGKFSDASIDALIDLGLREFDLKKRQEIYQQIMKKLVESGAYGVPLFESKVIYASLPQLLFIPRADGFILAHDIR